MSLCVTLCDEDGGEADQLLGESGGPAVTTSECLVCVGQAAGSGSVAEEKLKGQW